MSYTPDPKVRAQLYASAFPKWPAPRADERWLDGVWVLGNDFRSKTGYYGSYPPNYVRRVTSMFPEAGHMLHLFSGSMPKSTGYTTFDRRRVDGVVDPDVVGDAHRLSTFFRCGEFDLVMADPPYSAEDAERYGGDMIKRNVVMREVRRVTREGGNLVWLDTVLPMWSKRDWHLWGLICVVRSSNHRVHMASMFRAC